MPGRIVDGEGVWGSEKISKSHESVRGEYCNWLPLAEANGVFEVDPKRIWSRIYSYNRDKVSLDFVNFVVMEFNRVGLLFLWDSEDKMFGFWTGIDQKGRLPHPAQRKQYRKLPPDPPKELLEKYLEGVRGVTLGSPEGGVGGDVPNQSTPNQYQTNTKPGEENDMALSDKIRSIVYEKTRMAVDVRPWVVTAFRNGLGGEKEMIARFREWLDNNPDSGRPIQDFLEVADEIAEDSPKEIVVGGMIKQSKVRDLGIKLFEITELALSGKNLRPASNLLEVYSEDEILSAFRYFYVKLPDDFTRKMSLNSFFKDGGGEIVILSIRKQKTHQEQVLQKAATLPVEPLISASEVKDEDEGETIDF